MALDHASRSFLQAVLTPIELKHRAPRPWLRLAQLRDLAPSKTELARARDRARAEGSESDVAVLGGLDGSELETSSGMRAAAARLSQVDAESWQRVVARLTRARDESVAEAREEIRRLPATTRLSPGGLANVPALRQLGGRVRALRFDQKLEQMDANLVAHPERVARTMKAYDQEALDEPVGLLHLERITFAPAGIERGELVHSIPLAPAEEVSVERREWSNTSEEFQRIVSDYFEEFSEEGVAEKTDLSLATSSQHQHSMGLNTGVTASGGYGPVSVTTSLSVSIAEASTSSQQFSRNHSAQMTRKASERTRREHKVSFRTVRRAGAENATAQVIRNPFPDKTARLDYYQLIRRWHVRAYRYGVRLTYDIVVPEPGSDLFSRILEIESLKTGLRAGFAAEDSPDWAAFPLSPGDITLENYEQLAAKYGASVPPPPAPEHRWWSASATHFIPTIEESRSQFFTLEVTVDTDYEIDKVEVDHNHTVFNDAETQHFGFQDSGSLQDAWVGLSGKQILVYQAIGLASLYVELKVRGKVAAHVYDEWRVKAWSTLRDAAQARFYENRAFLTERLSQLSESLGDEDALSLRKAEREEIMKAVLRWLLGPSFAFVPAGTPEDLYGEDETVKNQAVWDCVRSHGEMIRFLHHAVEWENVMYVLYPYFWSHLSRWDQKKFLRHPDSTHQAFLKAGSARVVLTIRPGFENAFLSLMETGSFDGLPPGHPYLTVVEELQAFANTNYPGIPPANEEADPADPDPGVMFAQWNEYTSTSALDIAFNETLPTA